MSTTLQDPNKLKRAKLLIITASIAIPLVVALLFKVKIEDVDLKFLPPFYATLNGITAFLLVMALVAIKKKNQVAHRKYIRIALALSLLFLACYVAYHMTSEETKYGGTGLYKYLYYIILVSHIILSTAVVPIVLFTYLFAWQGNFERHKKWTRFAWPIWFYVATTGVIVYWMISPYYT
jgi:putative membrane protein